MKRIRTLIVLILFNIAGTLYGHDDYELKITAGSGVRHDFLTEMLSAQPASSGRIALPPQMQPSRLKYGRLRFSLNGDPTPHTALRFDILTAANTPPRSQANVTDIVPAGASAGLPPFTVIFQPKKPLGIRNTEFGLRVNLQFKNLLDWIAPGVSLGYHQEDARVDISRSLIQSDLFAQGSLTENTSGATAALQHRTRVRGAMPGVFLTLFPGRKFQVKTMSEYGHWMRGRSDNIYGAADSDMHFFYRKQKNRLHYRIYRYSLSVSYEIIEMVRLELAFQHVQSRQTYKRPVLSDALLLNNAPNEPYRFLSFYPYRSIEELVWRPQVTYRTDRKFVTLSLTFRFRDNP